MTLRRSHDGPTFGAILVPVSAIAQSGPKGESPAQRLPGRIAHKPRKKSR